MKLLMFHTYSLHFHNNNQGQLDIIPFKFSISLGMILRKSVVIREYRIQRLIVVFLSEVWKKGLEDLRPTAIISE